MDQQTIAGLILAYFLGGVLYLGISDACDETYFGLRTAVLWPIVVVILVIKLFGIALKEIYEFIRG